MADMADMSKASTHFGGRSPNINMLINRLTTIDGTWWDGLAKRLSLRSWRSLSPRMAPSQPHQSQWSWGSHAGRWGSFRLPETPWKERGGSLSPRGVIVIASWNHQLHDLKLDESDETFSKPLGDPTVLGNRGLWGPSRLFVSRAKTFRPGAKDLGQWKWRPSKKAAVESHRAWLRDKVEINRYSSTWKIGKIFSSGKATFSVVKD